VKFVSPLRGRGKLPLRSTVLQTIINVLS